MESRILPLTLFSFTFNKYLEKNLRLVQKACHLAFIMPLSVDMAVALQLRVLQAAIELIKTTANQDAQEQPGSLPSLSAPHRSMFQKRKGIAG